MTDRSVTHATFVIDRTYAAAPAREIIAFTAQFDDVAAVNETFMIAKMFVTAEIAQRRARGSDEQRPIRQLHFYSA